MTTALGTRDQQEVMEIADQIAILRDGRIDSAGSRRGRPPQAALSHLRQDGSIEVMVRCVVPLGADVHVDLELADGSEVRVQVTRDQVDELEVGGGDIVYLRPPGRGRTQPTGRPVAC